jgi:predicted GNAT family acetyltransferase
MTQFRDNTDDRRFEWDEDGVTSFCDYSIAQDGTRALLHVETPVAARGRGAAGRLMDAIIDYARAENFKLAPVCSYAVAHLHRRREAHDLLA